MESKWLEDFLVLAETGSFSRAAELRHVTQPAFSRRIQSLEAWLGVDLVERASHPPSLTPAGIVFYGQATAMLEQIQATRALLHGRRLAELGTIDIAVPHALAQSYVPRWLADIHAITGPLPTRVRARSHEDALAALAEGECDLLLCYQHDSRPVPLDGARFEDLPLGRDTLRPYARGSQAGHAEYCLPGRAELPVPYLAYAPGAYLAPVVNGILAALRPHPVLDLRHESDTAEGLRGMVEAGHGLAFLPGWCVPAETHGPRIVPAEGGLAGCAATLEIRLYRERPAPARPGKTVVARLWSLLERGRLNPID